MTTDPQPNSSQIDLFEVFRVGSSPKASVASTPLDQLQKRFTILSPILSHEQLESASALATLPMPGSLSSFCFGSFLFCFFSVPLSYLLQRNSTNRKI